MNPSSEAAGLLPGRGAAPRASFKAFLESFWMLGFLAYGGPTVHVALMHDKYVDGAPEPGRPRVPESTFVELFALASALPGPGSTQLATALGATFGGLGGAFLTFVIWSIPGCILMTSAGLWFHAQGAAGEGADADAVATLAKYFIGLISAAFAMVVIAAVRITGKTCAGDKIKMGVCVLSASVAVLIPPKQASWVFVLLLVFGGSIVLWDKRRSGSGNGGAVAEADDEFQQWESRISPISGAVLLCSFAVITVAVFLYRPTTLAGQVFKSFWKIGATVFGGGQVVIPWILVECASFLPIQTFLFGFGLISLCPGPMFGISWFLGGALVGLRGAGLAALGLFTPGFMLIAGALPFWERVRKWASFRIFLSGVNAAATGLIVAGVWMLLRKTLVGPLAYSLGLCAVALSLTYKVPTHWIIVGCGLAGLPFVTFNVGGPFTA